MQKVYKYPLDIADRQTLRLPQLLKNVAAPEQVLHIGEQNGAPMLWAMVDPALPSHDLTIRMFGTGQPCDASPDQYLGTLILYGGQLVLHLFYEQFNCA